jgi:hypothetical protein
MRFRAAIFVLALSAGAARAGETPCWFDNGAIIVPAAFGDMAGDFILDLSAARSVLHVTAAQEAGIETPSARASLRLAGLRRARFEMRIGDISDREGGLVTSLVGIIGADALAGEVVDIEAAPCRVRIERRARRLARAARLPVRWIDGVPAVRAAISDGRTSRAGWFAIDTGRLGARIADATLTRAPPPEAGDTPARLRALSVAGRLYENIPAGLGASMGLAGSIGEGAWSRYRMRLDLRRGWLQLGAPHPAR